MEELRKRQGLLSGPSDVRMRLRMRFCGGACDTTDVKKRKVARPVCVCVYKTILVRSIDRPKTRCWRRVNPIIALAPFTFFPVYVVLLPFFSVQRGNAPSISFFEFKIETRAFFSPAKFVHFLLIQPPASLCVLDRSVSL